MTAHSWAAVALGGPVTATGIDGPLAVTTESGSVTISGADGAQVDSGAGPVTATGIDGPLTATTDGGSLQLDGLADSAGRAADPSARRKSFGHGPRHAIMQSAVVNPPATQ